MSDDEKMVDEAQADPWASAFAALAEKDGSADDQAGQGAEPPADQAGQVDAGADDGGDVGGAVSGAEGPVSLADGTAGEDAGEAGGPEEPVAYESYEAYENDLRATMRDQALQEAGRYFAEHNVMHDSSGRLGAYPEHPSIMRKNDKGLPVFINPDTGEEFGGSNPRAEARAWCDEYNRTLEESLAKAVESRTNALMEEAAPQLRTMRFAPTYESLDPVRRAMLDDIIEDYVVTDKDGNEVGYSCDLDKALAQVNRIVASIQGMSKAQQPPTEPALDMKSSKGASDGKPPEFKSLAEAIEWDQDRQLEKMKEKR